MPRMYTKTIMENCLSWEEKDNNDKNNRNLLLFFFFCFFKRNICTCKFTAKLNHKGYLQIVTLLFRLPYVCLMIKFGSIRQRCVVHTACSLYIEKTAPIPCYKKKIVIAKKHFFFLLVSLIFSVYSSVLRTSTAHIFTIF